MSASWPWALLLVIFAGRWGWLMRKWGFWDWLSYGALAVGAIILALETALASSPQIHGVLPGFLLSPDWGYVPLVLISLASCVFVLKELGWVGRRPEVKLSEPNNLWPFKDEIAHNILGKNFRNERVLLDKTSFISCKFSNVTFVYNGTGPFHLSHNEFSGVWLVSENPSIEAALTAVQGLGFLRAGIGFAAPPGARIEPPSSQTKG